MATSVTLKPNAIDISGSTSGTTTLQASAVAGTTTLTLPAATDTLVGKATTDTLTNKTLTGAAMNGTLGATTPSTASVTTLTTSSTVTHSGGTANGVAYLDGSKALTTGSALVFDGTNLGVGVTPSAWSLGKAIEVGFTGKGIWANNQNEVIYPNNAYYNGGWKYSVSSYAPSQYAQRDGLHAWYTAASGTAGNAITFTQAMTLDSSGNLLVGTTSGGSQRISAYRNVSSTTKAANGIYWGGSNGTGADAHLQFTDSAAYNYYFGGNNGGAYVMATSNGVRLSNGGTSWASDSDERLKDIIEPITDAVVKVSTLRAVIGKYKTDEDGKRRAFLIAQDVQAVLPEAVFDEQGTLMLAYTETIPLLVAAIQEQQALITTLTARITALESA